MNRLATGLRSGVVAMPPSAAATSVRWSDRFALAQGERALQRVSRNLVFAQERHTAPAFCVAEELVPDPHHLRRTADAVVRAHRHHATAVTRLLVELIEVQLDLREELRG